MSKAQLAAVANEDTSGMLDIFSTFATDEVAENEGVWVPHSKARFLIGRAGNRNYVKLLGEQIEKHQLELDAKDEAADKLSQKIMIDVVAKTVLLGWENLAYKGKPLAYSVENAVMLLKHKDFRLLVSKMSDDINNFRSKLEETVAKN